MLTTDDRDRSPRDVVREILATPRFRAELTALATELGISAERAIKRAGAALDELVAVQNRRAVDLFYAMMRPLYASAWTVVADESGIDRLHELNKSGSLIFLPSHRSYVDTLVLGDVLDRNGFPRNHVMGGANLRIRPLSDLARRAGLIFIRRSFGDDAIYKAVVEEYFGYLLSKRTNLEWFFEGSRSRTGKLRPPKYGLLHYVIEAVRSGRARGVHLVPVSITYDRLSEVATMAAEQSGSEKRPEGLAWLAAYARAQHRSTGGSAHVRFGEPIPLADRLPGPEATRAENQLALQKVAFEVAVGINSSAPITANALLALTLLGVRDHSLTVEQVRRILEPILDYIETRGLPTTGLAQLRQSAGLRAVLLELIRAGVVTHYVDGLEPVYAIEPGQHLVAAFYRNNTIHWFVNRAIVELALLRAVEYRGRDMVIEGWREAQRIRDQLKFEFFFPGRETFEAQLRDELTLFSGRWHEAEDGDDVRRLLRESGVLMAHRVLRSFFDAQLVVLERLAALDANRVVEAGPFLDHCEFVGRQMLLQGRLHGPESLSRELFSSALDLAANLDLIDPTHPDLATRRQHAADYLRELVDRVRVIESLDDANRAEVTGVTS